jgi:chromosome segregation ATPase
LEEVETLESKLQKLKDQLSITNEKLHKPVESLKRRLEQTDELTSSVEKLSKSAESLKGHLEQTDKLTRSVLLDNR